MRPEGRALLWDARDAALAAQSYIAHSTLADFREQRLLRSAVEREFTVVGEALAQLRNSDPDLAARVPKLPKIVGFRTILVHGYGDIDRELVFTVTSEDVTTLMETITALLDTAD